MCTSFEQQKDFSRQLPTEKPKKISAERKIDQQARSKDKPTGDVVFLRFWSQNRLSRKIIAPWSLERKNVKRRFQTGTSGVPGVPDDPTNGLVGGPERLQTVPPAPGHRLSTRLTRLL